MQRCKSSIYSRHAVLLLLLTTPSTAQQSRTSGELTLRGTVSGFVGDVAGRPAAGADVFLLSRPFPDRSNVGTEDLVTALADGAGRFEAAILRGRAYTAWASFQRTGETHRRMTRAQDDVFPWTALKLGEDAHRIRKTLKLEGVAAWAPYAPLTGKVFSLSTYNVFTAPLAISAAGEITLPPVPGDECLVDIATKDQKTVASFRVGQVRESGGEDGRPRPLVEPAPETETLALPAPMTVAFKVADGTTGTVIAGAEIFGLRHWHGREARSFLLGVTGPDGKCSVLHPGVTVDTVHETSRDARVSNTYRIRAAGYEICRVDGDAPQFNVRLWPGPTLGGRVLRSDGSGAAFLPLLLEEVSPKTGGFQISDYPVPLATDAKGGFLFTGMQRTSAVRILTLMSEEEAQKAGIASDKDAALAPVQWLGNFHNPEAGATDVMISLGNLQVLELEVRLFEGRIATSPRVLVLSRDPHYPGWPHVSPIHAQGGKNGKVRLLVPRVALAIAAYVPGTGIGFLDLPPPDAAERSQVHRATLVIGRPVEVEGSMVTDKGEVIPDAELRVQVDDNLAYNDFMEEFLGEPTVELQPFRSDQKGRFRAFLPAGLRCRLGGRVLTKSGRWVSSYDKEATKIGEGNHQGLKVRAPSRK